MQNRGAQELESTPARVRLLHEEPEQDQEWIFLIRTGARAGTRIRFEREPEQECFLSQCF